MITPDYRTKTILQYLLEADRPVTTEKIGKNLKLTSRQVNYSLLQGDHWVKLKGMRIEKIPGTGISLKGSDSQKGLLKQDLGQIENQPSFFPFDSRYYSILFILFFSAEPINIKRLCYELKASKSTITRDLVIIRSWLKEFGLKLIGKPNYGLELKGEESLFRSCLSNLIVESIGEEELLNMLCSEEGQIFINDLVRQKYHPFVSHYINLLDLKNIFRLSKYFEKKISKKTSDNSLLKLSLITNISLFRIKQGFFIETSPATPGKYYRNEISQIFNEIFDEYKLPLKQCEKEYELIFFTYNFHYLIGQLSPKDYLTSSLSRTKKLSLQVVVNEIIESSSKKLHPSLLVNRDLKKYLTAIFREEDEKYHLTDRQLNNLEMNLKKEYTQILETCREINKELKEKFNYYLTDHELYNLAMCLIAAMQSLQAKELPVRVLLVCNAGTITAWLLESRIRTEFPKIEIAGRSSLTKLMERKSFNDIDLVISTVALTTINIPHIVVDPLLNDQNVKAIKDFISSKNLPELNQKKYDRLNQEPISLKTLLTEATIHLNLTANGWKEVVEKTGNCLLINGSIEKRFINAMKNVIIRNGPYMVLWPGIALLHANLSDGINRLGMSMATFKPPVNFGHEKNDPVDIALVIATPDNAIHCHALQQLLDLINDPGNLNIIRNAERKEQVIDLLI